MAGLYCSKMLPAPILTTFSIKVGGEKEERRFKDSLDISAMVELGTGLINMLS